MAACCQRPAVDYFSLSRTPRQQKNTAFSTSPFLWEQSPNTSGRLPSPEFCDSSASTLPSPTFATPVTYPNLYTLPAVELDQDIKANQDYDLGSFDDWIGWDDSCDRALSPEATDFFPELKVEPMSPNMKDLELQRVPNSAQNNEEAAAVFGDDQVNQPLFQTAGQPTENLYSTPLSWSPPAQTSDIRNSQAYMMAPALSPRQQSKLIAQAMPSRSNTYPSSPSSASSPEPEHRNGLKRKSTSYASDDEDDDSHSPPATSNGRHPRVKKTAHNMIEKRYRTNLNDKIAALRDSVPSLRVITKRNSRGEEVMEDLQGLTPAHKSNKATILSKATEYIAHLEKRNKMLMKENTALKSRVEAFEILMMAREPEQQQQQQQQQMRNGLTQSRQASTSRYQMDGMVE